MMKTPHFLCLVALGAMLVGCDILVEDYCDAWCDCVGCNDTSREACIDARENDENRAHELDCEDQWEDFATCVTDTYYCHEDELLHGCEHQETRWTDCVD